MLKGAKLPAFICVLSHLFLLAGCGGQDITSSSPAVESTLYLDTGDRQTFEVTGAVTGTERQWVIVKYYKDTDRVIETAPARRDSDGAYRYEFIAEEPARDDLYLTKVSFVARKVVCPLPVADCIISYGPSWFVYMNADQQVQPVWEGSFAINNANDVTKLSGFTSINGDLFIHDSTGSITTLAGLSALERVERDLVIEEHTSLTRLDPLSNLDYVGRDFQVRFNESLADFSGLRNLTFVGGALSVTDNRRLTDLDWLGSLESVGDSVRVADNGALTDLDGMSNFSTIAGNLRIERNASLKNIEGLQNISQVGGFLVLEGSPLLTSLRGLQGITTIGGGLRITNNPALLHLDELGNLLSVGGGLTLTNNDQLQNIQGLYNLTELEGLYLFRNHGLTSLSGLDNILTMGGSVTLMMNDSLADLSALHNVTAIEGDLSITDNTSLPTCEAETLSSQIGVGNISGSITIENNNGTLDCD